MCVIPRGHTCRTTDYARRFDAESTTAYANEHGRVELSLPLGEQKDVVGPHNHSVYGGWYYFASGGTPVLLQVNAFQMRLTALHHVIAIQHGTAQHHITALTRSCCRLPPHLHNLL